MSKVRDSMQEFAALNLGDNYAELTETALYGDEAVKIHRNVVANVFG